MNNNKDLYEARNSPVLNDVLGLVDAFTKEQERLWDDVRNCTENNRIPKELPADAVLFMSSDRFKDLPLLFKMQFAGRVFPNPLLQDDKMLIMKRPNITAG